MTFFDDHIDVGQLLKIRPLGGSLLTHHSVNLRLSSGNYVLAGKSMNGLSSLPLLDIRVRHHS